MPAKAVDIALHLSKALYWHYQNTGSERVRYNKVLQRIDAEFKDFLRQDVDRSEFILASIRLLD